MSIEYFNAADLFCSWSRGEIDERAPLEALLAELASVEKRLKELEAQKMCLRSGIQSITERFNGRYKLDGVADIAIGEPYTVASYDKSALDSLVRELLSNGEISTAQAIQAARSERTQLGVLRIVRR